VFCELGGFFFASVFGDRVIRVTMAALAELGRRDDRMLVTRACLGACGWATVAAQVPRTSDTSQVDYGILIFTHSSQARLRVHDDCRDRYERHFPASSL
jgi:hypothetical protein